MGPLRNIALAALLIALWAGFGAVDAQETAPQQYQNLLTPLLQGETDILGAPLSYPTGTANITAAMVTIPPGGETGWHSHEVPLFAHILEGELTVDYGDKGKKTYRAGDSVLEAVNVPHNGTNTGTVPMKLIAVYVGSDAAVNTTRVNAP